MFEKAKPPAIPSGASDAESMSAREVSLLDPTNGRSEVEGAAVEMLPLRAIEWSELTARLGAARDLRQLLREDVGTKAGGQDLGFADAAAQFFRTSEDGERGVNPTALEGRKASSGMKRNVISGRTRNPRGNGSRRESDPASADHDSAVAVAAKRHEPDDARDK